MKKLIALTLAGSMFYLPLSYAQSQQNSQKGLQLPEDIAQNASDRVAGQSGQAKANAGNLPDIEAPANPKNAAGTVVEAFRSGGRLERMTIERDNGIEEVYSNKRDDALWNGAEDELGDTKNMRSWKVGSW